jgi:hypothetical protein
MYKRAQTSILTNVFLIFIVVVVIVIIGALIFNFSNKVESGVDDAVNKISNGQSAYGTGEEVYPPSNIQALAISDSEIKLLWNYTNCTYILINRSTTSSFNSNVNSIMFDCNQTPNTTYLSYNLEAGTTYYYKLKTLLYRDGVWTTSATSPTVLNTTLTLANPINFTDINTNLCYLEMEIFENKTDSGENFYLLNVTSLYGDYSSSVKYKDIYSESPFSLDYYANNMLINSFALYSSRFGYYDNFGNEDDPGGIIEYNSSESDIIIPNLHYKNSLKFNGEKLVINDSGVFTNFPLTLYQIECKRNCAKAGEFIDLEKGERCCDPYSNILSKGSLSICESYNSQNECGDSCGDSNSPQKDYTLRINRNSINNAIIGTVADISPSSPRILCNAIRNPTKNSYLCNFTYPQGKNITLFSSFDSISWQPFDNISINPNCTQLGGKLDIIPNGYYCKFTINKDTEINITWTKVTTFKITAATYNIPSDQQSPIIGVEVDPSSNELPVTSALSNILSGEHLGDWCPNSYDWGRGINTNYDSCPTSRFKVGTVVRLIAPLEVDGHEFKYWEGEANGATEGSGGNPTCSRILGNHGEICEFNNINADYRGVARAIY